MEYGVLSGTFACFADPLTQTKVQDLNQSQLKPEIHVSIPGQPLS